MLQTVPASLRHKLIAVPKSVSAYPLQSYDTKFMTVSTHQLGKLMFREAPSSLNISWQKDNRYSTRFIILATRKTLHQLWFLPPSSDLARSQLKGLQFLWERYWQLRTPRTNLYTIFEPHREIAAFVISKTANTSYNKLLLGRNAHLEYIAVS